MLFCILSLLCYWLVQLTSGQSCPLSGKTPKVQTGFNYVIDELTIDMEGSTLTYPYGLNVCTPTTILSTSDYFKYTCSNSNGVEEVIKTQYSDEYCTTSGTQVMTWMQGGSLEGDIGYFECGQQDGYVKLILSDSSDCKSGNAQMIYTGLGGCGNNFGYSLEFACSSTQAQFQLYLDLVSNGGGGGGVYSSSSSPGGGSSTVCSAGMFCDEFILNSSCEPISGEFSLSLYGEMESCVTSTSATGAATTTTTTAPNGSVSLFFFNCFLLALIGTWFMF